MYRKGFKLLNDSIFFRFASFLTFHSVWWLLRILITIMYGTKTKNKKILKSVKSGIIVSNHTTPLDPLNMTLLSSPHPLHHTLLEATVKSPVVGNITRLLGGIPVPHGRDSLERFSNACKLGIKRRKFVHIYPEGECYIYNQNVMPFRRGAFEVSAKLHEPVIPVASVMKEGKFKPFSVFGRSVPKISLHVLEPVFPEKEGCYNEDGSINEENVKKFAQKVHDMIQNEINASGGSNAFNKGHMERLKGINK